MPADPGKRQQQLALRQRVRMSNAPCDLVVHVLEGALVAASPAWVTDLTTRL